MTWNHVARATCLLLALLVPACSRRPAELGFWFEAIDFTAAPIGSVSRADVETIAMAARDEIGRAFAGYAIVLSDRRDARYRVRVVSHLSDLRFTHDRGGPAGESFAVGGFGGAGAVNFALLASNAIGYAPAGATRPAIIAAIGRGVGATAAHEFVHQLFPGDPVDDRTNADSYEYEYAGRAQQYWGTLRWDRARPLLEQRFGPHAK